MPHSVALPVSLSCICGACELRGDEQPFSIYACHCVTCQRTSGTDYQHSARFAPGQLTVVKGADNLVSVRLPGSLVRRHFCGTCHVKVFHERHAADGSPRIEFQVIPVGLVTSRSGALDAAWRPEAQAWYGGRARDVLDELPKWRGFIGGSERWEPDSEPAGFAAATAPLPPDALPPLPAPPVAAACHCGQTALEAAEAGPLAVYYCHCASCQQLTGADFAHNSQFAPDQLRVVKGASGLLAFRKGESPRVTYRCGRCYDRMFREHQDASGAALKRVLPVGMVSKLGGAGDAAWQPRYHIWWAERACEMPDGLPKWTGSKDTSAAITEE